MNKLKRDLKAISVILVIGLIFFLYMDKQAYKKKYENEKRLHFQSMSNTNDLREIVQVRVDRLEQIALQNSRIFGYGQSFIKDIFDTENTGVDNEIDTIPEDWWELRIANRKGNHGLSSYDLLYPDLVWPTDISSSYTAFRTCEFGTKRKYCDKNNIMRFYVHTGLDIASAESKRIMAMSDGIIVATGITEDGTASVQSGQFIVIDCGNLLIRYFHLKKVEVSVGDIVTAGQRIGIMGNTGTLSDGEHLHLEFIDKRTGKYVNPVINSTWGFPVVESL